MRRRCIVVNLTNVWDQWRLLLSNSRKLATASCTFVVCTFIYLHFCANQ